MAPLRATDEKHPHLEKFSMPTSFTSRAGRPLLLLLTIALPIYLLGKFFGFSTSMATTGSVRHPHHASYPQTTTMNQSALVPLEAHIMSQCPDARDCLRDLVVPAMQRISDHVDFKLSFIGSIDSSNTIHCKHGATECLGNMLILCADSLYPNKAVVSLGFTNCLISSYDRIPKRDLVENCALEHGVDFDQLNSCISDVGKGMELLRASIERSQAAGVHMSCTVRVREKVWCVRDGGEWKNCEQGHEVDDLVGEILKS